MKTFSRLAVLLALILAPLLAPAQSFIFPPPPPDLTMIFRPFETEHVTLSPNGKHLAYTERQREGLFLVIHDLEANTRHRMFVSADRAPELSGAREKTPAQLTFVRWASTGRLVFNLNGRNIWSIDRDGKKLRRLADPRDFNPDAGPPIKLTYDEQGNVSLNFPPPPRAIDLAKEADQPVNVTAFPRDGNYVFVEAEMRRQNALTIQSPGARFVDDHPPETEGIRQRTILRVDLETGKSEEWGAADRRASSVVSDQQGYPRISVLPRVRGSLVTTFMYTAPRAAKWRPLDELMGSAAAPSFIVSPQNLLGERSIPLGFDYDSDLLYFASNVGRDTFGIYGINTKTWQRTSIAIETPAADLFNPTAPSNPLVFDDWQQRLVGVRYTGAERATLWFEEEFIQVQKLLDAADPAKRWEIVEWDKARKHFLVLATSNTEPGIFYVFDRAALRLDEVLSRAPWLTEAGRNPSTSFGFQTRAGVNLSGRLTLPRKPILRRPPLVMLCHDGPWSRNDPGYDREAQALAWMGFMVLQVNFRGSTGFGQAHLNAARDGFDTVALDDVLAAIDTVTPKNVDRRLVAIMGRGYGGYLALRAMQLHPTRFRCAVSIDAPTNLPTWVNPAEVSDELTVADSQLSLISNPWDQIEKTGPTFDGELRRAFLGSDAAKLRDTSPLSHAEKIAGPVMIIQREDFPTGRGRELARAVAKLGSYAEFVSLSRDEAADLPHARAALFTKIHAFLNENIYKYAVTLGDAVEVDAEKD